MELKLSKITDEVDWFGRNQSLWDRMEKTTYSHWWFKSMIWEEDTHLFTVALGLILVYSGFNKLNNYRKVST